MTVVYICRCGHTEGAHKGGPCWGLIRAVNPSGEMWTHGCECREFVAAGPQAVLL